MTMGATVSMGAITSFLGGFPLLFTEIVLFVRMGTLMVATVSLAWFWSLFLFVPLLIVFGPKGTDEWISKKNKTLREMLDKELLEYAQMELAGVDEMPQNIFQDMEDEVTMHSTPI